MRSLKFFIYLIFRLRYNTGIDSVYNRNEYEGYFLSGKGDQCAGLTTSPDLCAEYVELLEPQFPAALEASSGA
jgi:hypothetical protein